MDSPVKSVGVLHGVVLFLTVCAKLFIYLNALLFVFFLYACSDILFCFSGGGIVYGIGVFQSKRALSEDEITNARKKVSADLQLEGDYDYLPGLVVNEGDFPGEQQEQGIEEAPGQEDDEEEDIRENGHVGGAVG